MGSEECCSSPTPSEPPPERLTCVDVFSGIGGITLAIAPFAQPLQYCDLDRYCQSVLLQRMVDGQLDKAPIHTDIRNLHISSAVNPDMICGGFPCQDISSIGLQRGIVNGEKSSMFYEVMRLVDSKPSIKVVFLENVANILNCGIKEVVDEFSLRGFTFQWTLRSASAQGAPHARNRWFCLACRGDGASRVHAIVKSVMESSSSSESCDPLSGHSWDAEPKIRVSFRPVAKEDPSYDDHWGNRCQALGNAVVPIIVRNAFIDLALASKRWAQYEELLNDTGVPIQDLKYPFSDNAMVSNNLLFNIPKRRIVPVRHNVDINSPSGDKGNSEYVKYDNYPTPRRGITHASTVTTRSIRDLPTILVYCKQTAEYLQEVNYVLPPDKQLHSMLIPNVQYIEWMMGYPSNWTRIQHTSGGTIPMPLSRAAVSRAAKVVSQKEQDQEKDQEQDQDQDQEQEQDQEQDQGQEQDQDQDQDQEQLPECRKESKAKATRKPTAGQQRLHGMHMYMKEHPGLDVPTIAKMWRALADEERLIYSERARQTQEA